MELTPKQQRFVEEYLVDLNATQAAIRAGYSPETARQTASENLSKPDIQSAIAEARGSRSERTKITQDMVLNRWWEIANAEVNDLIQYRRVCCRYCHGGGHAYQWADEAEFRRAVERAVAESEDGDGPPKPPPTDEGGYGFNPTFDPHSECPRCHGEGNAEPFVADTRTLVGGARLLYDGVKITDRGLEVKMLDRAKALENVARHLGMFVDKTEVTGKDGGPVELTDAKADLLRRIARKPAG